MKSRLTVFLARAILAVTSIASLVFFVPWLAACAYLKPLPDTVKLQVEDSVSYDLDGIIVYIDMAGTPAERYAAGWNNRGLKIPAQADALFKIASISKLYIACATVMLIEDEKLSLDSILSDHFPELVGRIENADAISLRMLLQHRSGIPDWINDPEFPWATSLGNVDEYLELVLDDPANFQPGTRYEYSNTNFLLLGKILDKTLGYDHNLYIRRQILDPLGLDKTFGSLADVNIDELSSGYYTDYEGDVKLLDIVSPGGSMVATAEDVGIFLRALNDGSLLNTEEQIIYSSVYDYGHTGEWVGYTSIARYHKDIDAVVVLFTNTSGGNTWMINNIIYKRILRILNKRLPMDE